MWTLAWAVWALTCLVTASLPPEQTPVTGLTFNAEPSKMYPSWQCEIDTLEEEEGFNIDSCEASAMGTAEFYVAHAGACRVVSKHHDKIQFEVYPSSWKCEIDALEEEEGFNMDSCEASAMDNDEFYIAHGGACRVVSEHPDLRMSYLETVTCQYGRWSTARAESASGLHHRRRRKWDWVDTAVENLDGVSKVVEGVGKVAKGVVDVATGIYDAGCKFKWWCKSKAEVQTVVKKPPTYTTCPPSDVQSEYFVPSGQEEMVINWISPNAQDSDGSIQSNQQVAGLVNGGSFAGSSRAGGRQHTILYEARDDDGMTAFCYFSFTVKVRSCNALLWPRYGWRDCDNDNILGSKCRVTCNEGYTVANGISETTCSGNDDPQWSAEPSCEKITCSAPPDVTDGTVTCSSGHAYGEYCVMGCNDGYRLQGQVYTNCRANGNWFWLVPTTCTDGIAPDLTCKTPQIFYADRASSSVTAVWELPSATDNIDSAPTISQIGGPDPGVVLQAGSSAHATYVATDAAGNQSPPCNIELRPEVTFCGHPLNTFEDARLRFNCTTTPNYIFGDTCTLTCSLNLPLEGADTITCERNVTGAGPPVSYWDWGGGDMPYCSDIACPVINPPRNGALVFDWVAARPTSTMLCNENWDIPDLGAGFNGIFLCQDSGIWNPVYETAPGCTETFSTRGYLLPSEFFYYGGTCGVNDTILENFADILADLSNFFEALCPVGTVCEPQNPQVTCGEYDRRKRSAKSGVSRRRRSKRGKRNKDERPHMLTKRQTGPILVFTFDVAAFFDTRHMSNSEQFSHSDDVQLYLLKPEILNRVVDGLYDRPNWDPLTSDSFQTAAYGLPYCDPGSVLARKTKCSKCPGGHFEVDGVCVKCPIGEFSETTGSVACTQCPVGYSTRLLASDTLDNCTQLCTPGTYSPDTLVPCAQCEAGFYQPETGQTYCIPCPMGTSTKSAGSLVEADCQAYDAIVTDTGGYALTFNIPMLTNLALEFFMKTVSGTPDIVISVNGELDVAIGETITVSTALTTDDLGEPSDDAWIQVSIYWDVSTGEFKAFYRGSQVVSHSSLFPAVTPLVQNGQLHITASGSGVAMISGLRLHETLIGVAVDNVTASTCQNMDAADVVSMENLKYLEDITLSVPSVCDVVDECLSSPCGDHSSKCTDIVDGFICTCKGGWTGVTCDTPPDYCPGNDCQNGATCVSGLTNYTCHCQTGYYGVNCEESYVNGDWSVWSRWTECSATCNTGSRERTRSCDSPVPDPHGQDCTGVDIEMEDCNILPCTECPDIKRGHATVPVCKEDAVTGTKICRTACIDGYVRPPGMEDNDTFTCGKETDYKWQPRQNIPACIDKATQPAPVTYKTTETNGIEADADRPERYSVSVRASMDQTVPQYDEQDVSSAIVSNVASTACYSSPHCSADVQLGSAGRRRKRNTGTTVTITFTIALNDTSDLQLDQLAQNGTISPGLQEIIDAINNLEATAVAINDSASTYFDVTTNGVTYTVDANTVTFDGAATCSEGQVVTGGLCAECPAGSYQVGDYCSLCDKGTYQHQTGQAECVQCPYGFTSETVGSDASTDCSVPEITTSSLSTSMQNSTSTSSTSTTQSSSTASTQSSTTSTTPSSTTSTTPSSTMSSTPSSSTSTTKSSTTSTTQSSKTPTTQSSTTSTTPSSTTSSTPSSTTSTTQSSTTSTSQSSTTPTTQSFTTSTTPPSTTSTTQSSTTPTTQSFTTSTTPPSTTSTTQSSTTSTTQSSTTPTTQSSTTSTTPSLTTSTTPSSTTLTTKSSTTSTTHSSTTPTTQFSTTSTQSMTQSATSSTTTTQPDDDESENGVLLVIIIVVSVLGVLIIGVITVILCLMKHNSGRAKISDSTPDLRGMVNPVYNVPPMSVFIGKSAPLPPRPSTAITVRDLEFDEDPFNDSVKENDNKLCI